MLISRKLPLFTLENAIGLSLLNIQWGIGFMMKVPFVVLFSSISPPFVVPYFLNLSCTPIFFL